MMDLTDARDILSALIPPIHTSASKLIDRCFRILQRMIYLLLLLENGRSHLGSDRHWRMTTVYGA